jgi:hypothetical protein
MIFFIQLYNFFNIFNVFLKFYHYNIFLFILYEMNYFRIIHILYPNFKFLISLNIFQITNHKYMFPFLNV